MRTRIAMAFAAVALTACNGLTEPDLPKVMGNFSLVSVDGLPIPAAPSLNGPLILVRRIEIRSDGTFVDRRRTLVSEGGPPQEVVEQLRGEWVGHPQVIRMIAGEGDDAVIRDAFVAGSWMEITEDGRVWAFHLEFSGGSKFGLDREAARH